MSNHNDIFTNFFIKYHKKFVILIVILLVFPGLMLYVDNDHNIEIDTLSVTWSQDGTKLAFLGEVTRHLGQIIVWSKQSNSFETIDTVATKSYGFCEQFPSAKCINSDQELGSKEYFSFSPNNELLALMHLDDYRSCVLVYNLTNKRLIAYHELGELYPAGNNYPGAKMVWINDSLRFAAKNGVMDAFDNSSIIDFERYYTYFSPMLSNDGMKVAINYGTKGVVVIDLLSKSITHNITFKNLHSRPLDWSKDDTKLFIESTPVNLSHRLVNYTIYNLEENTITYSINATNHAIFSWTPDLEILVYREYKSLSPYLTYHKNTLIYPTQQINMSTSFISELVKISPSGKEIFHGNTHIFKISKISENKLIIGHKPYEYNRNLGFGSVITGIIVLLTMFFINKWLIKTDKI
ncbi:MAG: hypothetical protein ACXAC2_16500 [Candidatus Kariarchaeaceae archaeon]